MRRSIAQNTAEMVSNSWPAPEHQTRMMRVTGWAVAGLTALLSLLTFIAIFFKFGGNVGHWLHILILGSVALVLIRISIHTFVGPRLKSEHCQKTH